MLAMLCDAARAPLARCLVTGGEVLTPFIAQEWALRLMATRYPHAAAAHTLVSCLRQGVSLGYNDDREGTQELVSAAQNTGATYKDMEKQLRLGRRVGPLPAHPFHFFRSNPLGFVFKRLSTKPRVIHHLSWPRNGNSVNAGMREFDVKLDAFDRAVKSLGALGRNAYMAKIDIEAAYRCIPFDPLTGLFKGSGGRDKCTTTL